MLNFEQGNALLGVARNAIGSALGLASTAALPAWAQQPAATFVTLKRRGQLRGCIGSLEPRRSLAADIAHNAVAAARQDPRFPPVTAAEWPEVKVEISILSPASTISCRTEAELLRMLRPGIDGLILEYGHHRATYLPQVWEQLPTATEFVRQLKLKAGLSADWWQPEVRLARYQVQKFAED